MSIKREGLKVEFTGDHAYWFQERSFKRVLRAPVIAESPLYPAYIGVDYVVRKPPVTQERVAMGHFEVERHNPRYASVLLVIGTGRFTRGLKPMVAGVMHCTNEIADDPQALEALFDEMLHELERNYERA